MHRARCPITLAHIIQHGATNTDAGISLETGTLAVVKLAGRFEQADHARLDQVFHLNTGWQASQHMVSNTLDQGGIILHQPILRIGST